MRKLDRIDRSTRELSSDLLQRIEQSFRWEADILKAISDGKSCRHFKESRDALRSVSMAIEGSDRLLFVYLKFLQNLSFTEIANPYTKTLEWKYRDPVPETKPWVNFAERLDGRSESSLYWIIGKAGSGISGLMKFQYNNPLTVYSVQRCAPYIPPVIISASRVQCGKLIPVPGRRIWTAALC